MEREDFELLDDLESVVCDMERSECLFHAARTMTIDEGDGEAGDALLGIFRELFEGEMKRLREAYDALYGFYREFGKLGF